MGEMRGLDAADQYVCISDGQGAASPVACWTRVCAGALGANAHSGPLIEQDRAAAGCDGMDGEHGRADAHAADFCLESAIVDPVKARNVGRCSSHVEADHAVEAGLACCFGHADHATRRA